MELARLLPLCGIAFRPRLQQRRARALERVDADHLKVAVIGHRGARELELPLRYQEHLRARPESRWPGGQPRQPRRA